MNERLLVVLVIKQAVLNILDFGMEHYANAQNKIRMLLSLSTLHSHLGNQSRHQFPVFTKKKIFSRAFRTSEQNINVIPIIERQHLRQISSALL